LEDAKHKELLAIREQFRLEQESRDHFHGEKMHGYESTINNLHARLAADVEAAQRTIVENQHRHGEDCRNLEESKHREIQLVNESRHEEIKRIQAHFNEEISKLHAQMDLLKEHHRKEIESIHHSYSLKQEDVARIRHEYQEQMNGLTHKHSEECSSIQGHWSSEVEKLKHSHSEAISSLNSHHHSELSSLRSQYSS